MSKVSIRGPGIKGLRKLAARLGNMDQVRRQIAAAQSEEALNLINRGFSRQEDPYGQRWKSRKRETAKTRGRKILSGLTNRLQRGYKRTSLSSKGFTISSSVGYALAHQKPKKRRRPRRAMVPIESKGFPTKWRKPLTRVASDVVQDHLRAGQ